MRPNPLGLLPTDVPAVARWDWDSEHKQHYIGIKCGGRWCEVGAEGLVPSVGYVVADPRPELRRTRMIKGWYDQQFLAFQTGPGVVDVSLLLGTIYPSPDLDKWAEPAPASSYANRWITAAYAQIHPPLVLGSPAADLYRTRFNFAVTPVGTRMNEIQLCFGTAAACFDGTGTPRPAGTFVSDCETVTARWGTAPPWWSRVIQGGVRPGNVAFKCVRRRQHSGAVPHIPGAARWRWMVDDEGTWMRCLQGCCEKN